MWLFVLAVLVALTWTMALAPEEMVARMTEWMRVPDLEHKPGLVVMKYFSGARMFRGSRVAPDTHISARMRLAGLVLAAIAAAACTSATPAATSAPAAARSKSSYGQNLSLSMTLGNALAAGSTSVKADFALTNNGQEAFDGCFGSAWGVSVIDGSEHDAGHVVRVDRPSCVERFTLLPGQKISWSKKVPLGNLHAGTAKVTGWVKLVDPSTCDQAQRCRETSVASKLMTIAVGGR